MSPLLIKICKDFATIWTTIDPIGNVAIFAGLTAALTRVERRRTALRAVLYATVILVVAVVAGQIILDAIGIRRRVTEAGVSNSTVYRDKRETRALPGREIGEEFA